jgi:uncharacterized iron-regulated protein
MLVRCPRACSGCVASDFTYDATLLRLPSFNCRCYYLVMNTHTLRQIAAVLFLSTFLIPVSPAAALAPTHGCLDPATWTALSQAPLRKVEAAEILAEMAKREVVLLGEFHDQDDHHRWQVHTLAALHVLRPNMVIGFEMFPRRVQPALDKWIAGELSLKQFLEQSEWSRVWNMPAELYVPLFQFARIHRVPMVALNIDGALSKAVREKGWDQVPESLREGVGRPTKPPEAYLDFLFNTYRVHPVGHAANGAEASKTDPAFLRFVESQTTWDRAMAEMLARHALSGDAGQRPLAVGIMGSGHVRYGHGVPHQLRDLGVQRIGTLLPLSVETNCREVQPGMADAVFGLPAIPMDKPEPPRLGVRLDESDGGVRLSEVTPGSLAERTGLRAGDRLLQIGGLAPGNATRVVAMVRRQAPGSWLPVEVQRNGETLEFVIKFPVQQ